MGNYVKWLRLIGKKLPLKTQRKERGLYFQRKNLCI